MATGILSEMILIAGKVILEYSTFEDMYSSRASIGACCLSAVSNHTDIV